MKIVTLLIVAILACPALYFAQALSGNYTINSSMPTAGTNYQKFKEAAAALNTNGVSGPVVFSVKEGTYLDSLELLAISGASASNTILFKADPTNTLPVVLRANSNTATTGTVKFTGTKFFRMENIELQSSGTTYRRLVFLTGTAMSDISFEGCIFTGPAFTSASSSYASIYGATTSVGGAGLSFNNCTATENAYFYYNTGSSSIRTSKISVTNCNITTTGYCFYGSYVDSVNFVNNTLISTGTSSTVYSMYFFNSSAFPGVWANVQKNNISANTSSTFYGIYLTYYGSSAANPSKIVNNFVSNNSTGATGSRYAIYLTASANFDIDHNTVKISDGSTTTSRCLYFTSATGMSYTAGNYKIRNNIFYNESASTSGNLIYAASAAAGYIASISNNAYFSPNSTNAFYYNTTSYPDYSAWSAVSGDVNSLVGDPQFVSSTDLHVIGILANGNGLTLASVTTDIDGDTRPLPPSSAVDIGADEYTPPACPQPAAFTWNGGDTTSANFSWISSSSALSWYIEYGPVGFTPGTGTSINVASNPSSLNSLIPYTFYDAYVRSYCAVGDTSTYEGPLTFNTFAQGVIMETAFNCYPGGFQDISTSGIANPLLSDGVTGFAMPFELLVQNQLVSTINISNNGVIQFNNIGSAISGVNGNTMNTTAPQGLYPFWDDLDDVGGNVYYQTIGSAPNRKFIVQWDKKHDIYQAGTTFSFQVIMEERTNEIFYTYNNMIVGSATYNNGLSATIGFVGPNKRVPLSYNNVNFLQNNSCVHFYYTNCPKVEDPLVQFISSDEVGISWTPGSIVPPMYTIKYGPQGFDPLTSGTTLTSTTTSLIIPNLTQLTAYDIYIYANCSATETSRSVKLSALTLPNCANPSNFTTSLAVDSIFPTWSWMQNQTFALTGYQLLYDWKDFDTTTAGILVQSGLTAYDTIVNPDLISGGTYQIYVRAICGSFVSQFVGPIDIVMPLVNDSICGAEMLATDNRVYYLSNAGATVQTDEQQIAPPLTGNMTSTGWANNLIEKSTWFKFIAPSSGNVRIDCRDRSYNGQVAVYSAAACSPFSGMQLIAANDDDLDGNTLAPNFTVCGLTPGQEYYILHDSYNTVTGEYSIRVKAIHLNTGTTAPTADVCYGDNINLFTGVSSYTSGGFWVDLANTNHIYNDSMFKTTGLIPMTYAFAYRLEDGCAFSETTTDFTVFSKPNSGIGSTISVCKNEPFNLLAGMSGSMDFGGQWFDFNNVAIPSPVIAAGKLSVAGTYIFTYKVGNGVCPDASTIVTVSVGTCNWLGLDEEIRSTLVLFPNPSSDKINISAGVLFGLTQLEVLDMKGRVVLQQSVFVQDAQEVDVNIETLDNGMYMLRISNDGISTVKSFQKN